MVRIAGFTGIKAVPRQARAEALSTPDGRLSRPQRAALSRARQEPATCCHSGRGCLHLCRGISSTFKGGVVIRRLAGAECKSTSCGLHIGAGAVWIVSHRMLTAQGAGAPSSPCSACSVEQIRRVGGSDCASGPVDRRRRSPSAPRRSSKCPVRPAAR